MIRLSVSLCLPLALPVALAQNYAVASIRGAADGSSILGTVKFEQSESAPLGDITVTYSITGLPAGQKGFHVHQFGDTRVTDTLATMDAHFVPFCIPPEMDPTTGEPPAGASCQDDSVHGLPPSPKRQPGDMGNIEADNNGVAAATETIGQGKMSLTDSMRSIVGRVVVIHSKQDLGGNLAECRGLGRTETECDVDLTYGAAGLPLAYGVIGIGKRDGNKAQAPTLPKVNKIACTFEASPTASVVGQALLTLQEPCDRGSCKARMQAPTPLPPPPRARHAHAARVGVEAGGTCGLAPASGGPAYHVRRARTRPRSPA